MFILGFHETHKHENTRHLWPYAAPLSGCRRLSAGVARLMEGVKEKIKVIMYISNPQHIRRAKRQKLPLTTEPNIKSMHQSPSGSAVTMVTDYSE